MKICFRVDCHPKIGTGHLSRCLCLAKAFTKLGDDYKIFFMGRGFPDNLPNDYAIIYLDPLKSDLSIKVNDSSTWLGTTIAKDIHECIQYMNCFKFDILIVDHYGIEKIWETMIKPYVGKLVVIDDLANRGHDCHFLLDQTFRQANKNPYRGKLIGGGARIDLVPSQCQMLLGVRYSLINPVFGYRKKEQIDKYFNSGDLPQIRTVMITFGGSDLTGQTCQVLQALLDLYDLEKRLVGQLRKIIVVCGRLFVHVQALKDIVGKWARYRKSPEILPYQAVSQEKLVELLVSTDLCFGGAGVSAYERCCLGVPSVLITVADNQKDNAKNLDSAGAVKWLGHYDQWTSDQFEGLIKRYLDLPIELQQMAKSGLTMIDAHGSLRARDRILGLEKEIK